MKCSMKQVDNYRAEARNAGAALHTAVERLNARLQQEEAQLNVVRAEAANAAQAEAAVLGSLRGQMRGCRRVSVEAEKGMS